MGTTGTGKSTFSQVLKVVLGDAWEVIEVGKVVKEEQLYDEWDAKRGCTVFDPEKVYDYLENKLCGSEGGKIVEFHSSSCINVNWFKWMVCLRASTEELWSRLEEREYDEAKIKENVEAEIFDICLEELNEAWDDTEKGRLPVSETISSESKAFIIQNNTLDDLDDNVARVAALIS